MNKIEKLIEELCPDGVEFRALGKVVKLEKGRQLNKELLSENGLYPAYNGGISYSGFTDNYNYSENTIIISQGGASAGFVNFVTSKFYANAHCYIVLPKIEIVENRYIYHFLKLNQEKLTNKQHGAGIPALRTSEIIEMKIPIPPLTIQKEIVKILDNFTQLEAELEAELEARKKQYEHYREELLTFGDDVEFRALGEVCEKTLNIKWQNNKEQFQYIDLTSVDRSRNIITETKMITSATAPSRAQKIVKTGDVIFGTTRPTLKRFCIINNKYNEQICSTGFCVLRPNTKMVLTNYIFHFISSSSFYDYTEKNQKGASYPAISDTVVNKFKIPIPPLSKQKEIIAILDKFDALVNDISTGLPAEITARKKQYEYYRNQLLEFKVKSYEL